MKRLRVNLKDDSYDIIIEKGLLSRAGELIHTVYTGKTIALICDELVFSLYGKRLTDILQKEGFLVSPIVVKQGEESKSVAVLEDVYNELANMGLTRTDLIVAFGGGVVGDLSGFAAATYMRGVPYVQIPTTLLSQVDSSVGGKTGINLSYGKNLVGAFKQPKMVISDCALLDSMDERQWSGGFSEVIKYAAISSFGLFERLCQDNEREMLPDIIYECCDIKRRLVEADVFDKKERMLLNFGHTFGHAIEKLSHYEKSHGEAVAAGMVLACKTGEALGVTKAGCKEKIEALLEKFKLFTGPVDIEKLAPMMVLDKKNTGDVLNLILIRDIGESLIYPIKREEFLRLTQRGEGF